MFYLAIDNSTLLLYDQLEENEIRNMILLIQTIKTTEKRDNVIMVFDIQFILDFYVPVILANYHDLFCK